MRYTNFLNFTAAAVTIIFIGLSICGCVSALSSPTPRFYLLGAVDKSQLDKKSDAVFDGTVTIGPVKVPEYQNRPQIVTQDKNKMLTFAQFDRWGEPLDTGIARLVSESLSIIIPKATFKIYPCNFAIPVKYQVIIDIVQLESQLDGDLFLVAQWSVINAKDNKMVIAKTTEFQQKINPHDYSGLVGALNKASIMLSNEIADTLISLSSD